MPLMIADQSQRTKLFISLLSHLSVFFLCLRKYGENFSKKHKELFCQQRL